MPAMRIMLYVDDVTKIVEFWQANFGAKISTINSLPDAAKNIVLTLMPNVELSIFPKDFIAKYSPEVATNQPSLMLFRSDFKVLHERLSTAGPVVDQNGTLTFNFTDPEGHYFVVAQG